MSALDLIATASDTTFAGRVMMIMFKVAQNVASEDAGTPTTPDALGNGDHPLTGSPEAVAAGLRRYFDLGSDHIQVQLRPNSLEGVRAFAPVLDALRAEAA